MEGVCYLLQLTPDELARLREQPARAREWFFPGMVEPADGQPPIFTAYELLDLDQAAPGIYVWLSTRFPDQPLLAAALRGGTRLEANLDDGQLHCHEPAAVAQIAAALSELNPDQLADEVPHAAADDVIDPELQYLLVFYRQLRVYYLQAAEAGHAMVCFRA